MTEHSRSGVGGRGGHCAGRAPVNQTLRNGASFCVLGGHAGNGKQSSRGLVV